MTFQALNYKGNNFLDLTDNDNFHTKPIYMKNSTQLKHFEHFNILYVQISRAITNHASIGKYCNDLKLELRLHLGKDLRKCKGQFISGKV